MPTPKHNSYDQIIQAYLLERSSFKNHTCLRKFADLLQPGATGFEIISAEMDRAGGEKHLVVLAKAR